MSAQERADAEIQIASRPGYANPSVLAARMAFWDAGYKYEPRCVGKPLTPDTVSTCECAKAGTNTAVVCTTNEGFKCFLRWPLTAAWQAKSGAAEEKGIANCNPTFSPVADTSVPIGAAIVDESNSNLLIIGLAFLLLLSVWGHLRHGR